MSDLSEFEAEFGPHDEPESPREAHRRGVTIGIVAATGILAFGALPHSNKDAPDAQVNVQVRAQVRNEAGTSGRTDSGDSIHLAYQTLVTAQCVEKTSYGADDYPSLLTVIVENGMHTGGQLHRVPKSDLAGLYISDDALAGILHQTEVTPTPADPLADPLNALPFCE